MNRSIHALAEALVEAPDLVAAARAVLRPMLELIASCVQQSRFSGTCRVLRGLLHLRPDDGYRGLVALEANGELLPEGRSEPALPSLTAWRWVEQRAQAVALDVKSGEVTTVAGACLARYRMEGQDTFGSRYRLLRRSATHLLALPLRLAGKRTVGMVSIEVNCPAAVGRPFIWAACADELQLLVDLAAGYVALAPTTAERRVSRDELLPVIGESMQRTIGLLQTFARQEETILLKGDTGTGKTRLARWCHAQSPRRGGPLEVVDLLTVPEEMQLAELFGWRRGAFTGAVNDHQGLVSRAEGGTLFIDEIDKLSLRAQAGLLKLLEERCFRVLGDPAGEHESDVRFIIGTNGDLREAVAQGRFLGDLYHRINVLPMLLPPLAERRDEIPGWAEYMLRRRLDDGSNVAEVRLSESARSTLASLDWPGNLRQLDNIVRRSYAIARLDSARDEPLLITADHIEQALSLDSDRADVDDLLGALLAAARRFVAEVRRRRELDHGAVELGLDHAGALRGLVLAAAVELTGSRDEACRLLGKESLVAARNHHKLFRRERTRLDELYRALRADPDAPQLALLGGPSVQPTSEPGD